MENKDKKKDLSKYWFALIAGSILVVAFFFHSDYAKAGTK
jgi:hypothetical protein